VTLSAAKPAASVRSANVSARRDVDLTVTVILLERLPQSR
jgi:hypothetical protein